MDDRGRGERNTGPRDEPPARENRCELCLGWFTVLFVIQAEV
jgi:hypothetical protein